jgi:hypothetical protein
VVIGAGELAVDPLEVAGVDGADVLEPVAGVDGADELEPVDGVDPDALAVADAEALVLALFAVSAGSLPDATCV